MMKSLFRMEQWTGPPNISGSLGRDVRWDPRDMQEARKGKVSGWNWKGGGSHLLV